MDDRQILIIEARAELQLMLRFVDSEIPVRKAQIERALGSINALAALEGLDQHTSKAA